jgi:Xaa-Pro aminopeptidase
MESNFTCEFFAGNRKKLRQLFADTAPIVMAANGLLQSAGDATFPFRQDANFWYLTGIDEPDIVLVFDDNGEYLIVPDRDAVRTTFDGEINRDILSQRSGILEILDEKSGWNRLNTQIKKAKRVATIAVPPSYVEAAGIYTNPARAHLVQKIKDFNSEPELLDIGEHLARMRCIKQPEELIAIRQAIDITTDTLKEILVLPKRRKYSAEYEIEAELTRGFRWRGARGHAFAPIVASGRRACTLHYDSNSGKLAGNELIVLDVGAEVEYYAADVTRTIALQPPTKRQVAVHAAVLEVQACAFSLLKPGVILREYEEKIEYFMGEKLRELGLIKSATSESVRHYYPHATSHFLGLNAHDVGDRSQPLAEGMVLTVEPGIYIPKESLGIRIEDDVLVTKNGVEVLDNRLPSKLI